MLEERKHQEKGNVKKNEGIKNKKPIEEHSSVVAMTTTLNIPPPTSLMDRQGPPVLRQPLPVAWGLVKLYRH
uniref:Uncharacterized protein n=1 Tax=Romanomermis culicivorax TaxID=13658 RepID=A0A915KA50_ROMCU